MAGAVVHHVRCDSRFFRDASSSSQRPRRRCTASQTVAQQLLRLHARQHQRRKGMGCSARLGPPPLIPPIGVLDIAASHAQSMYTRWNISLACKLCCVLAAHITNTVPGGTHVSSYASIVQQNRSCLQEFVLHRCTYT